MLPTTVVRDKIEVANLALEAEEDDVFLRTLVPIYSQVDVSDVFSSDNKQKINKQLNNAKMAVKNGDKKSAKQSMELILTEVDGVEVDVDVVRLVRVCDEVDDLIKKRKFSTASKKISKSDVFFVYYADELITPSNMSRDVHAH